MQNSTALRINNTQPVAGKEKDNPSQRPQFGRRANPDIKPVVPQVNTPEVETRVDVEQIIHVSAPTLSFNTDGGYVVQIFDIPNDDITIESQKYNFYGA